MINMCLANPPSAYTLLFASKNGITECLSVHNFGQTRNFSFVLGVYDACLREQNETKECKLHFLIASKQLLHRMSLNRRNAKQ